VPVRLKDIARDLGVSVVTVSKVLRNHSDISPATRARVLRRIKELNYKPNPVARALVTGRSYMAGLVVPDLVHPFFAEVAKGLTSVLRTQGYSLVIASSEEDVSLERQEIDQMLARRLDVLLIASAQWTVETFRNIEEQQRPYILIDRKFSGLPANFVGTDDVAIGRLATEHLLANGCRRIAFLGGDYVSTAIERLEGYRATLAEAGITLPPEYILRQPHSDDQAEITGFRCMSDLLRLDPRPDAVFCSNDPLALGAMRAILEAGLRIPEDIAIVGSGNSSFAALLQTPLTSIDQDSKLLGATAAEMALGLVNAKEPVRPRQILLRPKLIARRSSLRVNNG
jgi:LacI family transcriptional regulator